MSRSVLENIETVPLADLTPYPGNPRRGNTDLISESLTENKQFAPLVVQRSTGHILSGNHTFAAASGLGWDTIDVVYVDVDDDQARKIVLAANRTADVAVYDDADLMAMLESLNQDYAGTGYTADDLDDLIASLDKLNDDTLRNTAHLTDYDGDGEFPHGTPGRTGSVCETVLMLNQEDHDELHAHLDALRASPAGDGATNGQLALMAARVLRDLAQTCEGHGVCDCGLCATYAARNDPAV